MLKLILILLMPIRILKGRLNGGGVIASLSDNMATELKPDPVKMDLSLAEKYIKENQKLWTEPQGQIISAATETEKEYIKLKFLDLAEQINENAALFSQLEYMRRGVHPNDVIDWDIKLLVQYLSYSCSARTVELEDPTPGRNFTQETPLANLGFYILDFRMYPKIEMICDEKSAPICTLFTQLCHKNGLDTIGLGLIKSNAAVDSGSDVTARCTGVICESADIDSAIDVFIGSTTKYPWKLSHIFVQESIYERFQTSMTSKCVGQQNSGDATQNKSYAYQDKTFIIDYLGDKLDNTRNNIFVEAYRTPKELFTLLKNTHYISLWCSDISQANEIAYNIDAKAIWINDYALFSGPPESSLAYYKIYLQNYNTKKVCNVKSLNEDVWLRKLRDSFKLFLNAYNTEDNRKFIEDALLSLSERNQKVQVDNEKGTLCVVDLKPSGIPVTGMGTANWMYIAQDMLYYVKEGVLVEGLTWDINTKIENVDIGKLFKVLEGKQVPVTFIDSGMKPQFIVDFYNPKAVWTTFGTVFAN